MTLRQTVAVKKNSHLFAEYSSLFIGLPPLGSLSLGLCSSAGRGLFTVQRTEDILQLVS